MHKFFRIILLGVLIAGGCGFASAKTHARTHTTLEPETLVYKVMFKWGLINKHAGTATLTLEKNPDTYSAQLAAASEPWADKIYKVRDTLNGRMTRDEFSPLFYERIAHEGNDHKHDVLVYDYSIPGKVSANVNREVMKKGKPKVSLSHKLESQRTALDLLTSFYYMRTLPFDSWSAGHVESMDIFSGKRKEILDIKYMGKVNLEIGGVQKEAYRIKFTFTSEGGKKTSDDMEAWIAADSSRIPLQLEGKLPIGKVRCVLANK